MRSSVILPPETLLGVEGRGQGGVGPTVDGDEPAVLPQTDPCPHADRSVAEFAVGYLQHDPEDVPVDSEVVAGPPEVVDDAVQVGEEGITSGVVLGRTQIGPAEVVRHGGLSVSVHPP